MWKQWYVSKHAVHLGITIMYTITVRVFSVNLWGKKSKNTTNKNKYKAA